MVGYGYYGQRTADLIESALQSSVVFGMNLGWRPFRSRDFEVQALGGASTTDEVVTGITGESLPDGTSRDVDIESSLGGDPEPLARR
jgi:hypothetical protein